MNKAPWTDFAGNDIHEGDTIQHPTSGERGTVVFLAHEERPIDQWRVDYGNGGISRLCLQIGDKGQAVVVPDELPRLTATLEANIPLCASAEADLELQQINFPPAAHWGRVSGFFMANPRWRWWSFWRPRLLYIPVKGQGTTL
jgi:hypothetical protein